MVLKELIFNNTLIWECVVVLKELVFNHFHFGWVWWSSKNSFLTIPTLTLMRGHWSSKNYFGSYFECVVVLKELIFNNFYFEEWVVVLKELIFNSLFLGGSGGLESTD